MESIDQSDHVGVQTNTCSLMKKRSTVRTSGVLRVVDIETASRNQIDALKVVHTDYTGSTKMMLSSREKVDQSDHVHVVTKTRSLMKKHMPVRSFGVLKVVDITTAMRNQNYALNGVHTDSDSIMKQMLRSMASIDQLELADAMTHTRSLMKKLLPVSTLSALKCVDTTTALEEQIDALNGVSTD